MFEKLKFMGEINEKESNFTVMWLFARNDYCINVSMQDKYAIYIKHNLSVYNVARVLLRFFLNG